MPTSTFNSVPAVMGVFRDARSINSVLDVGAGFGKYGVLVREQLDVRRRHYNKESWRSIIDAVEIWSPYITPLHRYIYDCIYVGDAVTVAGRISNYDVILLLDIVEHMSKDRGERLLKLLYEKSNKVLVVSFPQVFVENACSDWDNPYEEHRCLWTYADLKEVLPSAKGVSARVFHVYKD